jgi:VanZ family protein
MFFRYNLFTFCWLLLILLLTLTPGQAIPETSLWEELINVDKVVHFLIFSILVLLMIVGFTKQYRFASVRKYAVPAALGISIGYGLLIELIQIIIPDRGFELMDVVANTIGCFIGYAVFYLIYKY